MGYNQNNAGIHMRPRNYKYKSDIQSPYDKYAAIMAEDRNRRLKDDFLFNENYLIGYIEKLEKITLWDEKGQIKQCHCGGHLKLTTHNLTIQEGQTKLLIQVEGKVCKDCGQMFIVKDLLVNVLKDVINKGY